jgi:hypothetical protein
MSRRSIIAALHAMPDKAVAEIAIAVFWYWVYRLNGRIKRGS